MVDFISNIIVAIIGNVATEKLKKWLGLKTNQSQTSTIEDIKADGIASMIDIEQKDNKSINKTVKNISANGKESKINIKQ